MDIDETAIDHLHDEAHDVALGREVFDAFDVAQHGETQLQACRQEFHHCAAKLGCDDQAVPKFFIFAYRYIASRDQGLGDRLDVLVVRQLGCMSFERVEDITPKMFRGAIWAKLAKCDEFRAAIIQSVFVGDGVVQHVKPLCAYGDWLFAWSLHS